MAITETLVKYLEEKLAKDCLAFPMDTDDFANLWIGDEYRPVKEGDTFRFAWDDEDENFYILYHGEWMEAQSIDFDFIDTPILTEHSQN